MRHGLAESQFDSDFNRALSQVGASEATNVANQILASGLPLPERLLVSPFRRTQETANYVCQAWGRKADYETEAMLVHSGDHRILGDYLLSLNTANVMVISHMPIVAYLSQYLADGCNIHGFRTAQTINLQFDKHGRGAVSEQFLSLQ